jgi:hypothetical protein
MGEVMKASLIQRVSVASALTLIFTIASASAAAYSWTEILVPSIGPLGLVIGINDYDQVAVSNVDNSKSGIYRKGIFTPLISPPAGYSNVSATGINNSGAIVGNAFSPSDPTHQQGFILIGSKYTFFSRPGWDNTAARAISNSGLITGFNYNGVGNTPNPDFSTTAGFIYNPATKTFTDATPPGSGTGFSATQGMNASGHISGDGRLPDGSGRYAFVWQQGTLGSGGRQLAPFLAQIRIDGVGTVARGINDAGIITGFLNGGPGFVGSDSRGFLLLVPPGGDAAGAFAGCQGVNNLNHVVCGVSDALGNNRAFIGTPGANDQ